MYKNKSRTSPENEKEIKYLNVAINWVKYFSRYFKSIIETSLVRLLSNLAKYPFDDFLQLWRNNDFAVLLLFWSIFLMGFKTEMTRKT